MSIQTLLIVGWLLASGAAWAQPNPRQAGTSSQTIRITGDPAIARLLNRWEDQFRIQHGNVTFENRLSGPASAMAGLYTKAADLAFVGHELLTSESMAFEWIFHYKALPIEVTSGSLDGPSFAPEFFVNAGNPLSALTMTQARAVLGCSSPAVSTWGDLGLQGEWADKRIHLYSYDPESELGIFIRRKILQNSYKWNCEMKIFDDGTREARADSASGQIIEALREDRYGLGIANVRDASGEVKGLALADSDPTSGVALSKQSIIARQYPLARPFFAYINRPPGAAANDSVSAFLHFILSKDGQRQVVSSGEYLPLSEASALEQLKKLN